MEDENVVIDQSCLEKIRNTNILMKIKTKYWHKFTIENGASLDRDRVLYAVLDFISPFYLAPVKYTKLERDSYFYGRNCGDTIIKLCQNSLKIPYNSAYGISESQQEHLNVSIEVCSMKIDDFPINMKPILEKSIEKRLLMSDEEEINLSNFHSEPELQELVFCPLSTQKNSSYVLKLLVERLKKIQKIREENPKRINLSNNNLKNLDSLDILKDLESLRGLNLSNNEIDDRSKLFILGRSLPSLQEIKLNGNPMCSSYTSAIKYVKDVLVPIPSITKLDGIVIVCGLPIHRIWLCKDEGENLVNRFIEHYFTLYDSNRCLLEHTYHHNALVSIMCNEVEKSQQSSDLKLECYQSKSTNILKVNENVNELGQICRNKETIMKFLKDLPETEHDFGSFKIDLIHHENEMSIIMVSGVFKDIQEEVRIRSFNRTFVLYKTAEDQYKIINDLFQVTQATKDEVENSFLVPNFLKEKKRKKFVGNMQERRKMVEFVSEFTNMNENYSRKCLVDANWNIKKALDAYVGRHKALQVPPEAFSN